MSSSNIAIDANRTVGSKILLHPNTTAKVSLSHPEGVYEHLRLGGTIEGEQKLMALKKNDNVTCDNLLKIVKDGMKEYEKEFNKPMSYAEMRARFG